MERNSLLFIRKTINYRTIADLRKTILAVAPRVVVLRSCLIYRIFLIQFKVNIRIYYISYDLFSGYYQVFVSKECRDLSTFTATSGLRYRYVRPSHAHGFGGKSGNSVDRNYDA